MEEIGEGEESISMVFDIGSQFSKVGFSDDESPRAVFPTVVGRSRNPGIMIGMDCKDAFVGDEVYSKCGILRHLYPVQCGKIVDWKDFSKVIQHTTYNELRVNPEEESHEVLMGSSILTSENDLEILIRIMFEEFNVSKLQILPQTLLTLFSYGKVSGCVLESGDELSQSVSYIDGEQLKPELVEDFQYLYSDVSGSLVSEYTLHLLLERGYEFTTSGEREILRDIKEKMCYVSTDFLSDISNFNRDYPNPGNVDYRSISKNREEIVYWGKKTGKKDYKMEAYELPDGSILYIGSEKFRSTEILFDSSLDSKIVGRRYFPRSNPKKENRNVISLNELVYHSIMKSTKEKSRRDFLFNNIYLGGGNTLFTGMEERLEKEIGCLDSDKKNMIRVMSHRNIQKETIGNPKCMKKDWGKFSVWVGGSIVSQLRSFSDCYVTSNDYDEVGPSAITKRSLKGTLKNVIEQLMNKDGGKDLKERIEFVRDNFVLICEGFCVDVFVVGLECLNHRNEQKENIILKGNIPISDESQIWGFGKRSYRCTGTCYCGEDDEHRRSSTSSIAIKRMGYLVSSVSSFLAIRLATNHFRNECEDNLWTYCPDSMIMSEVDDCIEEDEDNELVERPISEEFLEEGISENDQCEDLKMVIGDMLECDEDFMMHQCNCLSTHGAGLSSAIFKKYPECDIYRDRIKPDIPGTIIIKKPVINLLAQYYPTAAPKGRYPDDNPEKRLEWFEECLTKVKEYFQDDQVSIAVPHKIGCGLGGGDWEEYRKILVSFGKENENIDLCMYKLPRKKGV